MTCPLCSQDSKLIPVDGPLHRKYFQCSNCWLIFLDRQLLLSESDEKNRYLLHDNGPEQTGHVSFLKRALEPVKHELSPEKAYLDFGCGPVPTLSEMLQRDYGVRCDIYDPLFFPDLPDEKYDFIFVIECIEHFFNPSKEFPVLKSLLNPGGQLVIMTEPWTSLETFKTWYYPKDPTHVSFYHERTVEFICQHYNLKRVPCDDNRVIVLHY